ncbi:hypothetical protein MSAN_00465700 [Mycena sanguinolenta]|uniref:Uncharacterized protein n=1 Tax=Mycena sanguinolenta TaxID=230812 RepID=A0A8H7DLM7_9AGAR|nr:hypothetical protein MSAN_00465700 [Mycena sanguinolenta]
MPPISTPVLLTTHNLHHGDRARLIRSTRKIGAVVGETPHVADPSLPEKPKPLRERLAPVLAPPDSRPVLYLRVPDSPPPESIRSVASPTASPTLTVKLNLRHNAAMRDSETVRRRRIAKLRRTLGEHVPTALVFPPENTNSSRYRRLTSRTVATPKSRPDSRRQSRASHISRQERSALHPEDISRGWVWVGKRDDIPADVQARIKRSKKESGLPFDWASIGRLRDLDEDEVPSPTAVRRPLHRKEVGWSGEWAGSAHNMKDVVHRLRGLKVK